MATEKIIDVWGRNTPKHIDRLVDKLYTALEAWDDYVTSLAEHSKVRQHHLQSIHGVNSGQKTYQNGNTLDIVSFSYEFEYESHRGVINETPISLKVLITDPKLRARYDRTKHAEKLTSIYNELISVMIEEKERRQILEKLTV